MPINSRSIGLRLFEFETALATSAIESASPSLRHFRKSRLAGQALRLAQLIRGMDVVDVDRLGALASIRLRIDPVVLDTIIDTLQEADLIALRNDKVYERVAQIDFGSNYARIGDLWLSKRPDGREAVAIHALDELVESPKFANELQAFSNQNKAHTDLVLEIGRNAHLIEPINVGRGEPVLLAPMLWDVEPVRFTAAMEQMSLSNLASVVNKIRTLPAGLDLTSPMLTAEERALAFSAVTVGLLPTYPVNSSGGERSFSFTPYSGMLIADATEREILSRARAILASVRYGEAHASWRIRFPIALLIALRDNHGLRAHPEHGQQYAPLVARGIGRVTKDGTMYRFDVIQSPENQRAVKLALELAKEGEILADKTSIETTTEGLRLSQPGSIGDEFHGIRLAHKQVKATDHELEELIEYARS